MCTQLDMHKFGHQHSPWGPSCCCYLSCLVSLSSWSLPAESWTCEKFYEHHESCSLCLACRLNMGSLQKKLVNVGILFEGGGLTHSQLLKTKSTTIQNSDFVAIWRGFPSPNQTNHQKSPITQKTFGEGGWVGQAGWDKIPTFTEFFLKSSLRLLMFCGIP